MTAARKVGGIGLVLISSSSLHLDSKEQGAQPALAMSPTPFRVSWASSSGVASFISVACGLDAGSQIETEMQGPGL